MSVPDSHFDACIMLGVLEFIRSPTQLFSRVHQKLKPGGVFGLTVPLKIASIYERKYGIRTFNPDDIERALRDSGFTIEKKERIHGYKLSSTLSVSYVALLGRKESKCAS